MERFMCAHALIQQVNVTLKIKKEKVDQEDLKATHEVAVREDSLEESRFLLKIIPLSIQEAILIQGG